MTSHAKRSDPPIRRHDLVFISPAGWRFLLATRGELAADALVASWVHRGWPLIGRRAMPGEASGVALGLPLPPSAGKRRLSFLAHPDDVVSIASPPALRVAGRAAPRSWWPTLDSLDALASRHRVEASVCGSLAWRSLTGLDYVTERSDLDLLLHVHRDTDLHRLTAELAVIDGEAPMPLDGELIRDDGAAVNWREFHAGARKILIKTVNDVALLDLHLFLGAGSPQ